MFFHLRLRKPSGLFPSPDHILDAVTKLFLKEYVFVTGTDSESVEIGWSGVFLLTPDWIFGVDKKREIPWLCELLIPTEDGMCFTELIKCFSAFVYFPFNFNGEQGILH